MDPGRLPRHQRAYPSAGLDECPYGGEHFQRRQSPLLQCETEGGQPSFQPPASAVKKAPSRAAEANAFMTGGQTLTLNNAKACLRE